MAARARNPGVIAVAAPLLRWICTEIARALN
jgi:hypothetical protein